MASSADLIFFAAILVITICSVVPGHVHEKFIIHAPIKFRTVHHYKVQKVPLVIKKHIHHHKYQTLHKHHFDHEPAIHPVVLDHSVELSDHDSHSSHGFDSFEDHYYR